MTGSITLKAHAKLNLYLDITGRRNDGYHLLETVMQSISLCDRVTVAAVGGEINVTCDAPHIPVGSGNICHKAARLYLDEIHCADGADISIEKRIPSGAGMGGGSADAAAVLLGLNMLYDNAVSGQRLAELALMCGADVPFCLCGGTKLCRGIGEEITPLADMAQGKYFVVVMPDFTCPTGEAYKKWDASPLPVWGKLDAFLEEGMECPENMYNVFEVLYSDKRIEKTRQKLLIEGGANAAMLTGSGAAVFGVFSDEETAQRAAGLFCGFAKVCVPTRSGIVIEEIIRQ